MTLQAVTGEKRIIYLKDLYQTLYFFGREVILDGNFNFLKLPFR